MNLALMSSGGVAAVPNGFAWSPPLSLARSGRKFFAQGFDVRTLAPTGKAYYVSITGNDGAAGSVDAPLRSIGVALAKADVDVVYVAAGVYDRLKGWAGRNPVRDVSIIGLGNVISTGHAAGLAFALDGVLTHTYKVSRSAVVSVVDASRTDAYGEYEQLTQRASAADVEANPSSWHLDGSNILWVRTGDSRVPDADLWPVLNVANGFCSGNRTIYIENINFAAAPVPFQMRSSGVGDIPQLYAKNCTFQRSTGNGLQVVGASLVICQSCSAHGNALDGFNYHAGNGIIPTAIELDCQGINNGIGSEANTNNGSTIHDAGSIVRVNGLYHSNKGPNVADVGEAQSWNLGCEAHSTLAAAAGGSQSNWYCSGAMWLDRCRSYGSSFDLVVEPTYTIFHKALISNGAMEGDGTITTY